MHKILKIFNVSSEDLSNTANKPTDKDLAEIEINISKQNMLITQFNNTKMQFNISTSKYGAGNVLDSYQTPLGKHIICEKIGDKAPIYTIFKSRIDTGQICKILNNSSGLNNEDLILSRILRLQGTESGVNLGNNASGQCVDSYIRCIYIHGTNREDLLSMPASNGCIRMSNYDIIYLFNILNLGTKVNIKLT